MEKNLTEIEEFEKLKSIDFCLISNNCWGNQIYSNLRREYNNPLIGLFLYPDCYIKLLDNFEENINSDLHFVENSKYFPYKRNYPIGIIKNQIEIHFLHYKSYDEVKNKWKRRLSRLNLFMTKSKQIFVKICDRDGLQIKHLKKFHDLNFENKISLSVNKFNNENHIYIPFLRLRNENQVLDGYNLFKYRNLYLNMPSWIIDKKINPLPL